MLHRVFFVLLLSQTSLICNAQRASHLVQVACRRNPQLSICGHMPKLETPDRGDFFADEDNKSEFPATPPPLENANENEQEAINLKKYIFDDQHSNSSSSSSESDTATSKDGEREDADKARTKLSEPISRELHLPPELDLEPESTNATRLPKHGSADPSALARPNLGDPDDGDLLVPPLPHPQKTEHARLKTNVSMAVPPPLEEIREGWTRNERVDTFQEGKAPEGETVLVAVSPFCVNSRERFVKTCHGNIPDDEAEFCKEYPLACEVTKLVIPVITYCRRYYKHFAKFCANPRNVTEKTKGFCIAFARFCLPNEEAPARGRAQEEIQPNRKSSPDSRTSSPASELRRCEDVVDEARKVCNPPPPATDRFNVYRCQQFFQNCRKFVDWL